MKQLRTIIATSMALVCLALSATALAEDADTIMKKADAVPDGDSFDRSAILLIVNSGKTEKKEFSSSSKEYGRKRRSRMQFSFPSKMGFLVWDKPGEDSQQWIKLTSGKVRKIASSEKSKPWMNSHFANEDISETYLEDYKYTLLGETEVRGIACYKIESVKIRGQKVYSKTVVYVDKESYLRHQVDFYENGRHTKTLHLTNYETISGIPTARKMTMERTDGKGKSVLYIKSVSYNVKLDDRSLTREAF